VFRVVPGATVRGTAEVTTDSTSDVDVEETVRLWTEVSIPGADFEYVRHATVEDGRFEVVVANPGTYRIDDTERTVEVTERMVREGGAVRVDG
jgi:dolichyl-diphosphooligosaccharide--protein glycosyltransferase